MWVRDMPSSTRNGRWLLRVWDGMSILIKRSNVVGADCLKAEEGR